MEMEIASMAMSMSASRTQDALSVSMLKKNMDAAEETMQGFIDMINSMPSPDGRGKLLNLRV